MEKDAGRLGDWHAPGGRRQSNKGVLFERMVTFHVALVLLSEAKDAFSLCSDHGGYGKFQDLVVVHEGSGKKVVEAIELKHSQRELGLRHFDPRTGKVRLTNFLKSYRDKRDTLQECVRLTLATNSTFDHSVADNFQTSDGCWFLGEADMWALKEDSRLRRDLGRPSDEDIEAFCRKLRIATGMTDVSGLKESIKKKLGKMYGTELPDGSSLLSFYLHVKENFEQWYDNEPRAITRERVKQFLSDALKALKS